MRKEGWRNMFFLLFASITGWVLWSIYSLFAYHCSSVAGKTVLVTGGSSTVGRCIIMRLLRLGANVVVWDYEKNKLEQLAQEASSLGVRKTHVSEDKSESSNELPNTFIRAQATEQNGSLTTSAVDLSSRIQLQRALAHLGPIHIMVNVAEDSRNTSFLNRTDESCERLLLSNVLCPLLLAKALLPSMLKQQHGGHIVTVTNKAGLMGVATQPDYAASQWASIGAHESIQMAIRQEGGNGRVRTTLVCSGGTVSTSRTPSSPSSRTTTQKESLGGPIGAEASKPAPPPRSFRLFPFASRSVTPEEIAESCIWGITYGVERVYTPSSLLLLPLLRVLPVPWFLWLVSSFATPLPVFSKN